MFRLRHEQRDDDDDDDDKDDDRDDKDGDDASDDGASLYAEPIEPRRALLPPPASPPFRGFPFRFGGSVKSIGSFHANTLFFVGDDGGDDDENVEQNDDDDDTTSELGAPGSSAFIDIDRSCALTLATLTPDIDRSCVFTPDFTSPARVCGRSCPCPCPGPFPLVDTSPTSLPFVRFPLPATAPVTAVARCLSFFSSFRDRATML
jgi:hypothetical protein